MNAAEGPSGCSCACGIGETVIGERGSEDGGGPAHACWYAEDQLGSRVGATDANGYKEMEVDYLEYGEPLLRKIALHIPANAISSTSYDSGVLVTRINLNANAPAFNTGDFVGMQLAISKTGVAEGYRMGNVVETSASPRYIKVYDPESTVSLRIAALVTPGSGSGLTIIDKPLVGDSTSPRLAGGWTSNPAYTGSADNTTIFTSETSPFGDCMEGWYLVPDVRRPVALRIVWAYQGQVAVSGNATTMADINSRFMIYPPPGIDPLTCKVAFDGNDCVTYLFASYRYMPSVGGALSTTASGTYYAWNRVYDPVIGRWTTPDPAQSPVWNLMEYCGNAPVRYTDAKGLDPTIINARGSTSYRYYSPWYRGPWGHRTSAEARYINDSYSGTVPAGKCCYFIWVHGFLNSLEGATQGFKEIEASYRQAGGDCEVVGFAWNSNPKSKASFDAAEAAADMVGRGAFNSLIRDIRAKSPSAKIFLAGHSLGARVILRGLSSGKDVRGICSTLLVSAAVDDEVLEKGEEFDNAYAFTGHIHNVYNDDDNTLTWWYGMSEGEDALGEEGMDDPDNVSGPNVSQYDYEGDWGNDHSGVYDQTKNARFWNQFAPKFGSCSPCN